MKVLGIETSCDEAFVPGGRRLRAPPVPPLAPGQAHPPAPALAAVSSQPNEVVQ